MTYRKIILMVIALLMVSLISVNVAAYEEIAVLGQRALSREDINFTVSDICSGHTYFNQVYVREDGWFATYTNFTKDALTTGGNVFGRVYIDIFDADAQFQKEISFDTSDNLGIILLEDTVQIYLYNTLLSYNWEKDELLAYLIPNHALHDSGLYRELHSSKLQVGEWTYKCKSDLHGYYALTKDNGVMKQTLLSYSGFRYAVGGLTATPIAISICAAGVAITSLLLLRKRKRQS